MRPQRSTITGAHGQAVAVEKYGSTAAAPPVPAAVKSRRAQRPATPAERRASRLEALQGEVRDLAARVRRLTISRRDPERFHMDRGEIAHQLDRLAERMA